MAESYPVNMSDRDKEIFMNAQLQIEKIVKAACTARGLTIGEHAMRYTLAQGAYSYAIARLFLEPPEDENDQCKIVGAIEENLASAMSTWLESLPLSDSGTRIMKV